MSSCLDKYIKYKTKYKKLKILLGGNQNNNLEFKFLENGVEISYNFSAEWIFNNKQEVISHDNNLIKIKYKIHEDLRNSIVTKNFYIGTGVSLIPLIKTQVANITVTYTTTVPIVISGLGVLEPKNKFTLNQPIHDIFRQFYFSSNNIYEKNNLMFIYQDNKEQILNNIYKNINKFLIKCSQFFKLKRTKNIYFCL